MRNKTLRKEFKGLGFGGTKVAPKGKRHSPNNSAERDWQTDRQKRETKALNGTRRMQQKIKVKKLIQDEHTA